MLWLREGFGFARAWSGREQNCRLAFCFGLLQINKASEPILAAFTSVCNRSACLVCRYRTRGRTDIGAIEIEADSLGELGRHLCAETRIGIGDADLDARVAPLITAYERIVGVALHMLQSRT